MNTLDALEEEQRRRVAAESERDEWRTRAQNAEGRIDAALAAMKLDQPHRHLLKGEGQWASPRSLRSEYLGGDI